MHILEILDFALVRFPLLRRCVVCFLEEGTLSWRNLFLVSWEGKLLNAFAYTESGWFSQRRTQIIEIILRSLHQRVLNCFIQSLVRIHRFIPTLRYFLPPNLDKALYSRISPWMSEEVYFILIKRIKFSAWHFTQNPKLKWLLVPEGGVVSSTGWPDELFFVSVVHCRAVLRDHFLRSREGTFQGYSGFERGFFRYRLYFVLCYF